MVDNDRVLGGASREERAAATLAEVDHPGTRTARITVRPSWVG
jgi:hypothetical protein